MKDDRLYIIHILERMEKIEAYTQDGKDVSMQACMIQDAVIRNFEVMGEAAKRISNSFKQTYSNVPWRRITGIRDVLIHDYINVELEILWKTVEEDLPDLKVQI